MPWLPPPIPVTLRERRLILDALNDGLGWEDAHVIHGIGRTAFFAVADELARPATETRGPV